MGDQDPDINHLKKIMLKESPLKWSKGKMVNQAKCEYLENKKHVVFASELEKIR